MTLAEAVRALLDKNDIPHALIGAAALAAAGVVRSTIDLDVLTIDTRVLDGSFWHDISASGAHIDTRRGDADDPLAGVVRITSPPDRPVDVIVGRHAWQQRAVERALELASGERVVQPHDLVLLKLYAGGAQDLWDVEQLLATPIADDVITKVEHDVPALPPDAQALWRTVAAKDRR